MWRSLITWLTLLSPLGPLVRGPKDINSWCHAGDFWIPEGIPTSTTNSSYTYIICRRRWTENGRRKVWEVSIRRGYFLLTQPNRCAGGPPSKCARDLPIIKYPHEVTDHLWPQGMHVAVRRNKLQEETNACPTRAKHYVYFFFFSMGDLYRTNFHLVLNLVWGFIPQPTTHLLESSQTGKGTSVNTVVRRRPPLSIHLIDHIVIYR